MLTHDILKQDLNRLESESGRITAARPLAVPSPHRETIEIFRIGYLSDGLTINGFLMRPVGPGPFPAIIYNRPGIGDSHKITEETLRYLSILPAAGFVVGATQYRGNDGSEGSESYLTHDIDDARNMMALVRSLPYVEPQRLGILGFSRGAAVTYLLLKEQVDIRAACVMGCAVDFPDAYQELPHYRMFLEAMFHGTPDTAPDEYIKRSPLYWPEKINVPLLIIQGTDDQHVPMHQVHQLAEKLKNLGKTHELVIYPEGDHELDKERADKDQRIIRGFRKYL